MSVTEMMRWGTLPSFAMTFKREMVSLFPTTSSSTLGRYFSTLSGMSPLGHLRWVVTTYHGSSYGRSDPLAFAAMK
jgi:hypothetical protein